MSAGISKFVATAGGVEARTCESSEPRLAGLLSRVLLSGLTLAVLLMVTGAVLAAVRPEIPVPRESSVVGLPRALAALEPGGFFHLGILVLLASPVARILVLLVAFARSKRWVFCGLCLLVLAILIMSAFLGLRNG